MPGWAEPTITVPVGCWRCPEELPPAGSALLLLPLPCARLCPSPAQGCPPQPAFGSVPRSHSPRAGTRWELFGSMFTSLKVSWPSGARADLASLIQPYFQPFCMLACSRPVFLYRLFFQLLTVFSSPILSCSLSFPLL